LSNPVEALSCRPAALIVASARQSLIDGVLPAGDER
jgi:hypothetical protein